MYKLKMHVQSGNTEELNYTPCGLHTTRITYVPSQVTCLVCKRKPEYRRLQDILLADQKPLVAKGPTFNRQTPPKIGITIHLAAGQMPSVSFRQKDIVEVNESPSFICVVTELGKNSYNMEYVVGIVMTKFISDVKYKYYAG